MAATGIDFAPLAPWSLIAGLAALALVLLSLAWWRRASGGLLRGLAIAAGLLALANPSLVEERRQPFKDVVAVVVDRSPSQTIAGRGAQTEAALEALLKRIEALGDLDVRVVEAAAKVTAGDAESNLFAAARKALIDVPAERMAATIIISDGQVHDAGSAPSDDDRGPVHSLITGQRGERDRRLVVRKTPAYGMVGGRLNLTLKIEDTGKARNSSGTARVTLRFDNKEAQYFDLKLGRDEDIPFVLEHAGATVIEIEVQAGADELTLRNNRAVVVVNGVRERLNVLLISGEPHAGERTWRNLLKADPSVDLVHFTILRPPEKQDGTPVRELSLIAFPIFELFEVRLEDFDLVIFDRYRRRGVLPPAYFLNIAEYVQNGGALLTAAGPAFASNNSIHRTALRDVLPGAPSGDVRVGGYRPKLTDLGRRHPVTADLPGAGSADKTPGWGRWFRLIEAKAEGGMSAMSGPGGAPLLLLDRAGEGRVAQLMSDHAWLWTRGFEGGGPQAELLRRLAHWLMKEPELEEEDLRLGVEGDRLLITRRSLKAETAPVTVKTPSGEVHEITLKEGAGGRWQGQLPAADIGIYRAEGGGRTAVAVVGALNPKEFAEVHATDKVLQSVSDATGGGLHWLNEGPSRTAGVPDLRRVKPGRIAAGKGWLGLRANGAYRVTGVSRLPLMPALLALLLIVGALVGAWWREGK